jgi:hypothetical protein
MLLEFVYLNWRGVQHRYVVDFAVGHNPGLEMLNPDRDSNGNQIPGSAHTPHLSGYVVTRDGEPKGHRRSFELTKIKELKVYGDQ